MNKHHPIKMLIVGVAVGISTLSYLSTPAFADEDEHEEGPIELSEEQIEQSGIGVATVQNANIREALRVYGKIVSNAEKVQLVNARYGGSIRTVTKSIGDTVRRGDTLLTVEANNSLKDYSIKSSVNGVVTQRNANVGEQTKDRVLFKIEDFSTVWVDLTLFPKDLAQVQAGQSVRVSSLDRTLLAEGRISYIEPASRGANQAVMARVVIENPELTWRPGQFVTAEITLTETMAPITVRNEALQIVDEETVVFVKGEEGFEPRAVILGRSDGELSEVISGVQPEEIYITKNSFLLKADLGKGDIEDDD